MTNFPQPSPGTESSVPGAVSPPQGSDAQTVAALQSMLTAMAASLAVPSPPYAAATTSSLASASNVPVSSSAASTPLAVYPSNAPVPVGFLTGAPWVAGALYRVVPAAPLMLVVDDANDGQPLWYCISRGAYVGVTTNNSLAVSAVSGVSRSAMNSHKTQVLAVTAFNQLLSLNMVAVVGP